MPFDEKTKGGPWSHITFFSKVGFRKPRLPVVDHPFDPEKHTRLLRSGYLQFTDRPEEKCVYIDKRHNGGGHSGFGTAATRHVFQISDKLGYGGHIRNGASWSSHLFHLGQGMVPEAALKPTSGINWLVRYNYGTSGEDAIKNLNSCENENDLLQLGSRDLRNLKFILIDTRKNTRESEEITVQDIFLHRKYILNYGHEITYMQGYFIPKLLHLLEKNIGNKYPDTKSWGQIDMTLSAERRARWHDAIVNSKEFVPFRRYEHMRKYMTQEQIERLDRVLEISEQEIARRDALKLAEERAQLMQEPLKLPPGISRIPLSEPIDTSEMVRNFICRI